MDRRAGLSQMQYLAATRPGPLLVVAGAGSGKTSVLVHRIGAIAVRGEDPGRILALTFSRKAAAELRERLRAVLADAATRVVAATFHAYALRLLRRRGRGFAIVDRADARALVRRCLGSLGRPADAASVRRHLDAIGRAKSRLAALDGPVALCYADALRAQAGLDLDDLIVEAIRLLDDVAIGREERLRYDHVLVDEFQDTSVAQFALLRHLAREGVDVCAVGDEDQSIYAWRAAEPENLARFREAFPAAAVLTLAENYRSTQVILDVANAVIARNPDRIPKRLFTGRTGGEPTLVIEAADERDEAAALADLVASALAAGTSPSEAAILYRVNAQARPLERALLARGIPHAVVRGIAFVERAEVRDAIALLRLVRDERDDAAFRRIAPRLGKGLGPGALERLAAHAPLLPAARLGVLPPRYHSAIARVVAAVDGLRSQGGPLTGLVWSVWRTLGHADDPATTQGELLAALLELAEGAGSLEALLDELALYQEPEPDVARDAVNLLTLHAAKGLEFSVVCIAGFEEGLLPHRRALDDPRELAEERRLCYVGMTRAKDRLVLSYALARGALSLGSASRFLEDIPPELTRLRRTGAAEALAAPRAALELRLGDRVRHPRWGEGRVEKLEELEGASFVTIRFADRSRRVRTEYAPLERLAGGDA